MKKHKPIGDFLVECLISQIKKSLHADVVRLINGDLVGPLRGVFSKKILNHLTDEMKGLGEE